MNLDGITRIKKRYQSTSSGSGQIEMPQIPKSFINHARIRSVLCHTIEEFAFEEQVAVYWYCFLALPISEIAELTELSQDHVAGALTLYSQRLSMKLNLFKKALHYDADDALPVSEIL